MLLRVELLNVAENEDLRREIAACLEIALAAGLWSHSRGNVWWSDPPSATPTMMRCRHYQVRVEVVEDHGK